MGFNLLTENLETGTLEKINSYGLIILIASSKVLFDKSIFSNIKLYVENSISKNFQDNYQVYIYIYVKYFK